MRKRILSLMLCCVMLLGLMPTAVFAEGGSNANTGKAIRLGTDGISGYSDDGGYHFIYFGNWEALDSNTTSGPIRWRVLDDQTNTGESGLFLLSDVLLGTGSMGGVYFDNTSRFSNAWQGSSAQAWCRDFAGESGAESNVNDAFTAGELGAILATSKSDAEFDSEHHTFCASENILSGDRVFFLSAEEAENDEYGFTDDAAQVANYGTSAGIWWLRSFLNEDELPFAGAIGDRGSVVKEGVINPLAARPAFNLDTSSVLFTSAAAGGKADTAVDESLTAVGAGTGEWKLTLLDNSRKSFTASVGTGTALMQKPGYSDWTVSIDYSGAPTGANEYVSAMLADESGTLLYYGRIVSNSASGTATVTIPAGLAPGSYTLKVFSEQYNGDKQTDYASAFENINLTVGYKEQFSLAPGSTYYFDLSGADIPGDNNGSLPDGSLHWVPFTYAGTVNAYVLKSRSANDNTARGDSANAAGSTDPDNPIGYTYDHSLFIADYNVTRGANWHNLNAKNLIFGKAYTSGGVDYTLRVPSAGSSGTASGGTPASNEWDAILDKANQSYQDNTVGYIKNWNGMYSWGQDTQDGPDPDWNRATRGSSTARSWQFDLQLSPSVGFRPVLELPSSDTLGSDGLKAITLDLNGGKLGGSADDIQIIVKNGSAFTAPASGGLTRPDGNDGTCFMWQDSSGNFYEPGDTVPAGVGRLTAIWEEWTKLTKDVLESTYKAYSVGAYLYRLPSGNYYLGEDISVDIGIDIGTYATPANVTLDLNGHELKDVSNNTSLIYFPSTSSTNTLTLMDSSSSKTGKVISSSGTAAKLSANAKLNANGGTIEGLVELAGNTAVIDNTDPSNVTVFTGWVSLYGGTIKGGIFTGTVGIESGTIADSAKVTVTFNSDGGSTVAEQKVLRGQKVSEPTAPTKAGYSFEGWYNGDTKYDFTGAVTENITLTARWKDSVNPVITGLENNKTYCDTVEFEVSDNVGVASVQVDGVEWTPDANNRFTLSPAEGIQTIVVTDKAGNETSVTVTVNDGHTYGAWQSNGDETHTHYCTVEGCNGSEDGDCDGGEASYFNKAVCDTCHAEYGNLLTDSTAPTGEISIGTKKWDSFLNKITFGLFFKNTQSVTITASDDSYSHDGYTDDKAVKVEYYLYSGDAALTQADLAGKEFTEYDGDFNINPDNKYVVYARVTDHAGNVTYISSEGVVLDASAPVISGVENGKTYCEAQTVTVTEEYIASVTVNGTDVTLDANNQFTLSPAEGTQTIVVTDKAGNQTTASVTVNDGHIYEWQSENGQYWQKCKFCNHETAKKDIPTINISGADKVCRTQDYKFSFTLPEGATDTAYGYEFIGLGDGSLTPTFEGGMYCGVIKSAAYPAEETSFKLIVSAKTADGFEFSAEKTVAIQNEHSGGTATCKDKAICEVCGESYGELDPNNHANLKHIDAKAATKTSEGNIEYWYCDGCNKYYKDAKATQEITKAQTVTAKLPDDSKSPQTGDNSNLALWIALLFVSGGAVTATTVYGRKKKRLTK